MKEETVETTMMLVKDKDYRRVHVQGVVANSRDSGDIYLEWYEDLESLKKKATFYEGGETKVEPLETDYERTFYVGMTINAYHLNSVIINLLEQYRSINGKYPDYVRYDEGESTDE